MAEHNGTAVDHEGMQSLWLFLGSAKMKGMLGSGRREPMLKTPHTLAH
jgi:hypothetical protein